MEINFNVKEIQYKDRLGNLDAEAKGEVKSKKYFPFYFIDGKTMIYKPLSKTKPFTTPYFAYSEVVWSTILNKFFDSSIPIYQLAKCHGYEKEVPKYYDYGTLVESIVKDDERLINLYEYFELNQDENVDISKYINYCMKFYNYSFFFLSELFKKNPEISKEISRQILYSILRADQNYHYENVALVYQNGRIKKVASPIDHEFSTHFLYLDTEKEHLSLYGKYINGLLDDPTLEMSPITLLLYKDLTDEQKRIFESAMIKNIEAISKVHPEVIDEFIDKLNIMLQDLSQKPIMLEDHNYITPFNSFDYEEGIARYKEQDYVKAQRLKEATPKHEVPVETVNANLNNEILNSASILKRTLEDKRK